MKLHAALLLITLGLTFQACYMGSSLQNSVTILDRSSWKADSAKPFTAQTPSQITVHHEGTFFDTTKQDPKEHIKHIQQWGMGKERHWADVPFHYFIDPAGIIYEGRNILVMGEATTHENLAGQIQIALLGNFEQQEPTPKQISSLTTLLAICCQKYSITTDGIHLHNEFTVTQCPGKNLLKYFNDGSIKKQVKALMQQ
jgi:hypothetical protein